MKLTRCTMIVVVLLSACRAAPGTLPASPSVDPSAALATGTAIPSPSATPKPLTVGDSGGALSFLVGTAGLGHDLLRMQRSA